jgi:peptidoglycan hydrolase-like protein with peptidoglycan-binding domain
MTKRKRKSPEKKPVRKEQGRLARSGAYIGGVIARHPTTVGGTLAFAVIFGFVAANALWYQPGGHPSPFLRTRDAHDPTALAGYRPATIAHDPADVTTFKIERDPASTTAATGVSSPATATQPAVPAADGSVLLVDVQTELTRRGLYSGVADGKIGPRTTAAIVAFQQKVGMSPTGEATPEVLAALKVASQSAKTVPAARPAEDVTSKASAVDPVAAAIRGAERTVQTAPARTPAARIENASLSTAAPRTDASLILQIQRGLVNLAYTDVTIDGVAGDQTRAAIRHFEKHYRLPETGEPNEVVLKKLKSIGAL